MWAYQNSHYFSKPFSLQNSPKFLSNMYHCEGSTILVYPNGMKFLWHLHMPKWSPFTHFQLNPSNHVSATSWSSFWASYCSCKATMSNTGPNLFKIHRIIVPPTLSLWDILVISYLIPFDHNIMTKLATANFSRPFPSTHSGFLWAITSGRTHLGRTAR